MHYRCNLFSFLLFCFVFIFRHYYFTWLCSQLFVFNNASHSLISHKSFIFTLSISIWISQTSNGVVKHYFSLHLYFFFISRLYNLRSTFNYISTHLSMNCYWDFINYNDFYRFSWKTLIEANLFWIYWKIFSFWETQAFSEFIQPSTKQIPTAWSKYMTNTTHYSIGNCYTDKSIYYSSNWYSSFSYIYCESIFLLFDILLILDNSLNVNWWHNYNKGKVFLYFLYLILKFLQFIWHCLWWPNISSHNYCLSIGCNNY